MRIGRSAAHGLQKIDRADAVGMQAADRVAEGIRDARLSGQMEDGLWCECGNQFATGSCIAGVEGVELQSWVLVDAQFRQAPVATVARVLSAKNHYGWWSSAT